jgi:hypothetical protein
MREVNRRGGTEGARKEKKRKRRTNRRETYEGSVLNVDHIEFSFTTESVGGEESADSRTGQREVSVSESTLLRGTIRHSTTTKERNSSVSE